MIIKNVWFRITHVNEFRLYEEAKAQHDTEKLKLTDEISVLKESKQKIEIENQSFKSKIAEQKLANDSQHEKLR